MHIATRIIVLSAIFICTLNLVGTVSATSLGTDWKQSPYLPDSVFSGAAITPDGDAVFAGGSQLVYRSWNDSPHWGGQAGFITSMSPDGNWVITASDTVATLYNKTGFNMWSRSMGGEIRAVAVAPDAAFTVTADSMGNYITWNRNGELMARNTSDIAKRIAITPKGDLIVVTTERGLRYCSSLLGPVWTNAREGSLEENIVISQDGSTIITWGGVWLSSQTPQGVRNWQVEMSNAVINDVACSEDCSLIIVGSQDNAVRGLDRYGKVHWTYKAAQWVNAVGLSANGRVIAAGVNDGNVIILDHNGRLQTEKKFSMRIQPGTLAVSRDGTRIAVADQHYLYGLSVYDADLTGENEDTIYVTAPITTVPKTSPPTTVETTPIPEEILPEETQPAPTTTKASPVGVTVILSGIAGALFLAGKCCRKT